MRSLRRHCLVLALAFIAGASACKKEGDGAGAGGGAAGGAADDLNVIPANSDFVVGINLSKLRDSAVFKEYGQKVMAKATSEISEFKASCGFDPVDTIKSVAMGIKTNGDKGSGSVIVHTSATKEQLKACLEKSKADAEAKGTKIVMDGDIAFITPKDGTGFMALTFLGSDGVVGMFKETEWTKADVQAALSGAGSIKSSKPFLDMYGDLKKGQTLWFYVNGASELVAKSNPMKLDAVGFFGTLNVTDGLSSEFRARMKSAADAKAAEDALKGQMASAQMFFTKADMKADGNDLRMDMELTGSQLKGIAQMFGMGKLGAGSTDPTPEAPSPQ